MFLFLNLIIMVSPIKQMNTQTWNHTEATWDWLKPEAEQSWTEVFILLTFTLYFDSFQLISLSAASSHEKQPKFNLEFKLWICKVLMKQVEFGALSQDVFSWLVFPSSFPSSVCHCLHCLTYLSDLPDPQWCWCCWCHWSFPLSQSQTANACSPSLSAEFNTSTCWPRDFSLIL